MLRRRIAERSGVAGIIGLGYVGAPLAVELARVGFQVIGFDIEPDVVSEINAGRTRTRDIDPDELKTLVQNGRLSATTEFEQLARCDAIVICVPTPLSKIKDPDLSAVLAAAHLIRAHLRTGQLVVLESTTYPGTTRDVVLPILAETGLVVGEEFFLCFSPERVDPGNKIWTIHNTPKLVGGITDACRALGKAFYEGVVERVIDVTSVEAAELAKVYENTFRMVNIALANELALVCARLGLDVWEVVEAAATKPFGFMRFAPGPGLGGHCIPLDPHYLSWKMETLDFKTRLIELASEINAQMPAFVVQLVSDALNEDGKAVRGSTILLLGIAYKADVGDYRESPALEIIRRLKAKGADVLYHDPYCPEIVEDGSGRTAGLAQRSVELDAAQLRSADVVVLVTDHAVFDREWLMANARVIVDTRGALRNCQGAARVVSISGMGAATPFADS
jgi:UDP-N-acetyl-D-glucosamine dehydrogenase